MTSVICEENISLLPHSPPTVLEESNVLQLIHPNLTDQNISLLPPSPPTVLEESNVLQLIHPDLTDQNNIETQEHVRCQDNFILGNFEYVTDISEREMLINAWQAITMTENWNFVKQPIESFSWSNDPRINIISNKMVELGYDRHSGSSFGYTMRAMQYIAQNGEDKYKEMRDIN
jgi:hypothetical protein